MTDLASSVEKGGRDRAAMIRRFGFIPYSVLRIVRGELSRSLFNLAAERKAGRVRGSDSLARIDAFVTDAGKAKAEQRRAAGLFGGVREYAQQSDRTTLSVMAAELVDFFVRYYARPGDTYLDPFAGHGVRMQVAALRGLDYLGMDLSADFVRYMNAVRARLAVADGQRVEVRQGDSRSPDWIADGVGSFCFTSPPYWDIEYYGPEPEQLGTGKSYAEFLVGMREVLQAWRPKFKPGAWVVLNVNDIRRDGRFYPYHSDLIGVAREAGYALHDLWVIEGLVSGLPKAFAVDFNLKRIAPKVHEYALVLRPA